MTVFSAPDYPQFQTTEQRYCNLGAVLRLSEPDYATPEPLQFAAQLPRPPVRRMHAMLPAWQSGTGACLLPIKLRCQGAHWMFACEL